jgi:hypothetical protein
MNLWLDSETRSPEPIKNGVAKYAERAEVILFAWAIDDEEPHVLDRLLGPLDWPKRLREALHNPDCLVWFQNAWFDWNVLETDPDPNMRYFCEIVPPERRRDTMVQAYLHGLPGALEALCAALGVADEKAKDKRGRALIQRFCVPNKAGGFNRPEDFPEDWAEFKRYAGKDIIAMRECHRRMPKWNNTAKQWALWALDQKINRRGICVDVELARAAVEASEKAKATLARRTQALTNGDVERATQRDQLIAHILETYGIELPDMTSATLERRIKDEALPDELRELLAVRLESATGSVSKFKTLLRSVNADGRLRGTMQFRGAARTGRVAHRLFQPGNMPRPTLSKELILIAIDAIKHDYVDLIFDDIMAACSNCIRSALIPGPGKKLVVADLANIEGRFAAWLAGEEWKLQAFRDYDTIIGEIKGKKQRAGQDLYLLAYARAFGVEVETVPEKGDERQIGKVCLAEGSLILTNSGWKPIETVSISDQLWDGVEWVSHQGLLSQGTKSVISLGALHLTPDHSVLCETQWTEAATLQRESTKLSRALATGAAHLPLRAIWSALWAGLQQCSSVAIAGALSTACSRTISAAAVALGVRNADAGPLSISAGGSTRTQCLKLSTAFAYSSVSRLPASAALPRTTPGGKTMAPGVFASAVSGSKTALLFSRMSAHCRAGMTRAWRWTARILTGTMNPATSSSSLSGKTCSTADASRNFRPKSTVCEKQMPTFDLACAGPRKRFTALTSRGPLIVHNCELMLQYGGGVGAFITGAATYSIDLAQMTEQVYDKLPEWALTEAKKFLGWLYEDAEEAFLLGKIDEEACERRKLKARLGLAEKTFVACDAIKRLWRHAHPEISTYWKELEETIRYCIANPGEVCPARKVKMKVSGRWLRIGLPSGRELCYPGVGIDVVEEDPETGRKRTYSGISYKGHNQYSRKWSRISTYGGKVFENITQAVACDQLKEPQFAIEEDGFGIVLDIHDEIVSEADADRDDLNADKLGAMMCADLVWNRGLPLAAAGYETTGPYRKD